jgi:thiol-disulfide isomerase/thioredoxin/predicted nucleic acid-binding protein
MLVDAGRLVSLCDRNQPTHTRCQAVLETSVVPITSTWACFVAAMYHVGRIGGYPLQRHLWALLNRGIVRFHGHSDVEGTQMAELMDRYQNVPMDLADASLVAVAEASGDRTIFTLDGNFRVYRLADGGLFDIVPEKPYLSGREAKETPMSNACSHSVRSAAVAVMILLMLSLGAGIALAQTTNPSPRSAEAIQADLQQTILKLQDALQEGKALQSAEARQAAGPKIAAAVNKMLSLFDELAVAQPDQKVQIDQMAIQFRVLGALVDDPVQTAILEKSAAGNDVDASRAKAALAIADFIKAPDDAGRDKAIDAYGAALKTAPDDNALLSLISMTSLASSPSNEVDQRLITALKTNTRNPAAQEFADEIEGHLKQKAMENKPLVIAAVSLNDPHFSTANWKGKVILVDFWATWCGPCLGELPRVKKMYADYHSKGLEVLGVSCDNSGDDLRKFLTANPDMPWPQLFDDSAPGWNALAKSYGIDSIPTMYLIDRKGILRTVDARSQMEDLIPKLLAEEP